MGSIIIAGAGPGDPELVTVKTLKAIQSADVILYDALVSEQLVQQCGSACKLIYVGKRKGKKEFSQEEINHLLTFYARKYEKVLRLKGGDPYVFGRGHEELFYIVRKGFSAEVIPGVSSAVAAPLAEGIPLTKRGINESFWVVTGTLSNGMLSNDFHHASKSSATIIVLMGLSHLAEIAESVSINRSEDEPMAIIRSATTLSQQCITGRAKDICMLARASAIETPAIIIIGKVVDERQRLKNIIGQTEEFISKQ